MSPQILTIKAVGRWANFHKLSHCNSILEKSYFLLLRSEQNIFILYRVLKLKEVIN